MRIGVFLFSVCRKMRREPTCGCRGEGNRDQTRPGEAGAPGARQALSLQGLRLGRAGLGHGQGASPGWPTWAAGPAGSGCGWRPRVRLGGGGEIS